MKVLRKKCEKEVEGICTTNILMSGILVALTLGVLFFIYIAQKSVENEDVKSGFQKQKTVV